MRFKIFLVLHSHYTLVVWIVSHCRKRLKGSLWPPFVLVPDTIIYSHCFSPWPVFASSDSRSGEEASVSSGGETDSLSLWYIARQTQFWWERATKTTLHIRSRTLTSTFLCNVPRLEFIYDPTAFLYRNFLRHLLSRHFLKTRLPALLPTPSYLQQNITYPSLQQNNNSSHFNNSILKIIFLI